MQGVSCPVHRLTLKSYADCLITSGAIQKGVPTNVFLLIWVSVSCPATPKSASFTSPCSDKSTLAAGEGQKMEDSQNARTSNTSNAENKVSTNTSSSMKPVHSFIFVTLVLYLGFSYGKLSFQHQLLTHTYTHRYTFNTCHML